MEEIYMLLADFSNRFFIVKKTFTKIQSVAFGLSTLCNYSHLHKKCPVYYSKEHIIMPSRIFYKVVDELHKVNYRGFIYLSVYNEPLIDPRLFLFAKYAKKKLPKCTVGFTSNGYYLDQNLVDEMKDNGIDGINISVYTQSEFERFQKINFSIPVTFRDYIGYANMDGRINVYNESNRQAAKCSVAAPYHNILINHNGDVCLCCIDWQYRHTFGNVLQKSLFEIINSSEFQKTSELTETGGGGQSILSCKNCPGQYFGPIA
jgi:radical SAM protein with 4Fe4S-binding SPASM domain